MRRPVLLASTLLVAGCQAGPPAPAPAAKPVASAAAPRPAGAPAPAPVAAVASASGAAAASRFGAPITATNAVPLARIASSPDEFVQRVVKTEGTVSAVCQSAGCWMEITDEGSNAHIRMSGHSFFVPKTCSGRHAVVQAKVLPSSTPSACAGHCEGASAGAACQGCGMGAEAKAERVELEATGVELL